MQDGEEKKKAQPEPGAEPRPAALKTGSDLYGDEGDITARPRRKGKSGSAKSKKKKGAKAKSKKASAKKVSLFVRAEALLRHLRDGAVERDSRGRRSLVLFHRRIPLLRIAILLGVLFVLLAAIRMGNSGIHVDDRQVTIVGLAPDLENYKILVISDLAAHRFGDTQSALVRTINNLQYNAVFFLGDMVGPSGDADPFYELLESIPRSKKVFFICGDSDPGPYVEHPRDITGTLSQVVLEDWILGAIERGATYVDSPTLMEVGETNVWITPATLLNYDASELVTLWKDQTAQEEDGVLSGLESDYQTLPATTYRNRIAQKLYSAIGSIQSDDFVLAMAHEPLTESFIRASAAHDTSTSKYLEDPDLILAGHYCSGVWRLPVLGAFYIPDSTLPRGGWLPAQNQVQGLSSVGETQVYITGGLWINAAQPIMRFRLFNQPEVSLLTLTARLPDSMLDFE